MKYKELDNVKWVLTLLIVIYHIQFNGSEQYKTAFMAIKNMGDCVVPAFAVISGFLFWKNVKGISDLKSKSFRRITSLLVPYLLWNLLNTIFLNFVSCGWGEFHKIFEIDIWENIIKWSSSPHFWYIFMLMFWTVFSPALYFAYKKKFCLVLLLLSQLIYFIIMGNNILHSRFIYILYTWAGMLGIYKPGLLDKILIWPRKRKIVVSSISFFAYFLIYWVYYYLQPGMFVQVWLYSVRSLFLILATINLPMFALGQMLKFKYSFWIFIVHYWLVSYTSMYIYRLGLNPLLVQIITWIVVVFIGVLSGIILNKLLPKVFSVLVGNRILNGNEYKIATDDSVASGIGDSMSN